MKIKVTISPELRRKEPKTTTPGLGYVSAGLLLWLESQEPEQVEPNAVKQEEDDKFPDLLREVSVQANVDHTQRSLLERAADWIDVLSEKLKCPACGVSRLDCVSCGCVEEERAKLRRLINDLEAIRPIEKQAQATS